MRTTHTTISEQDWFDQFRPHLDDNQTYGVVNYGYQTEAERRVLEQAHAERRLWTYCHTGVGNYYLVQGWAYVNREFYVICDVPVPEGVEYDVESEETFYCETCGNWFDDMNTAKGSVTRAEADASTCVKCAAGEDPDGEGEGDECCETCGDAFGTGEFAPSSVDPSQCHYCYTTGADDE